MEEKQSMANEGYKVYRSEKDSFSFEIPLNCKDVAYSEHSIPTATGTGKMVSYVTQNQEKAFMLGITDLGITLDTGACVRVMEYARNNVLENSTLIQSDKIEYHDHPALTLRVSRKEKDILTFMDILFCIFNDRQYQLEVVTAKESELTDPDAVHFFESFRYFGNPETTP